MCLLAYSASTGTRSEEHSADVSASSGLSFFYSGPNYIRWIISIYFLYPLFGFLSLLSMEFNSNKAGLFEGSFSWAGEGGVVSFTPSPPPPPSFIFQEEPIQFQ